MFIEGFHALYHIQIGKLKTTALFDMGASINAISSKFFRCLYQQLKIIPTNRKVVLADGDCSGPIGEVHQKFQLGKVIFNDRFIILNNLQRDAILGLPWQSNYKIGCDWKREGNHFTTIKGQFLDNSISQDTTRKLAKMKGQYTLQDRSVTWIAVKSPPHLNNDSLHKIQFDRQLPSGVIPLDTTHKLNHKYPRELLIPLLHISHKEVKIPKNTILGSVNSITDTDTIQVLWQKIQNTEEKAVKNTAQDPQVHKLLPIFLENSNFLIHAHDISKPAVMLQDTEIPQAARDKLIHATSLHV